MLIAIENYGIKEGNPANIIIIDAESEFDAIRLTSEVLYTIRNGKIISKIDPAERIFYNNSKEERIDFKLKES